MCICVCERERDGGMREKEQRRARERERVRESACVWETEKIAASREAGGRVRANIQNSKSWTKAVFSVYSQQYLACLSLLQFTPEGTCPAGLRHARWGSQRPSRAFSMSIGHLTWRSRVLLVGYITIAVSNL